LPIPHQSKTNDLFVPQNSLAHYGIVDFKKTLQGGGCGGTILTPINNMPIVGLTWVADGE